MSRTACPAQKPDQRRNSNPLSRQNKKGVTQVLVSPWKHPPPKVLRRKWPYGDNSWKGPLSSKTLAQQGSWPNLHAMIVDPGWVN